MGVTDRCVPTKCGGRGAKAVENSESRSFEFFVPEVLVCKQGFVDRVPRKLWIVFARKTERLSPLVLRDQVQVDPVYVFGPCGKAAGRC